MVATDRKVINGDSGERAICTSYVERHNLTVWRFMRSSARLSLGFSRMLERLAAALPMMPSVGGDNRPSGCGTVCSVQRNGRWHRIDRQQPPFSEDEHRWQANGSPCLDLTYCTLVCSVVIQYHRYFFYDALAVYRQAKNGCDQAVATRQLMVLYSELSVAILCKEAEATLPRAEQLGTLPHDGRYRGCLLIGVRPRHLEGKRYRKISSVIGILASNVRPS